MGVQIRTPSSLRLLCPPTYVLGTLEASLRHHILELESDSDNIFEREQT